MVRQPQRPEPNGFSMVEVIVAVVILTVGLLAMATTTGYVFTRIRDSGRTTERAIAVQQVIEQIRAMPYTDVAVRDSAHAEKVGDYTLWWGAKEIGNLKRVVVVCMGPGYTAELEWAPAVQDTTVITVLEPQ